MKRLVAPLVLALAAAPLANFAAPLQAQQSQSGLEQVNAYIRGGLHPD